MLLFKIEGFFFGYWEGKIEGLTLSLFICIKYVRVSNKDRHNVPLNIVMSWENPNINSELTSQSFAFVFYTFFSIEHEEDSEEQSINNKG